MAQLLNIANTVICTLQYFTAFAADCLETTKTYINYTRTSLCTAYEYYRLNILVCQFKTLHIPIYQETFSVGICM